MFCFVLSRFVFETKVSLAGSGWSSIYNSPASTVLLSNWESTPGSPGPVSIVFLAIYLHLAFEIFHLIFLKSESSVIHQTMGIHSIPLESSSGKEETGRGEGRHLDHQGRARQDGGTMEIRKMLMGGDSLGTRTVVDLGLMGKTGWGGPHGQ